MADDRAKEGDGHGEAAAQPLPFVVAYLFWLVMFLAIFVATWIASTDGGVFRYAGF